MNGLRQAMSFLTRLPMGRPETADGGIGKAAAWFPFAGALVGLTVAAAYSILYPWLPSLLGAVLAVAAGVWLTGALHEDGLADSFDAFGSGHTGEEALRIMRDSRLGSYGTAALTVSILWRVVAVGSLTPAGAVAGLVTAHTLGRTGAVALMSLTPAARPDGLGASGVSVVTALGAALAVASGIGLSLLAAGWLVGVIVVIVVLTVVSLRWLAMRRVNGITGDVLGACEQIIEMGSLAIVAGAAWRGWLPWWVG